jgi:hypothetical protein
MAIPTPLSVGGTLEYLIQTQTVANDTIAKKNVSWSVLHFGFNCLGA